MLISDPNNIIEACARRLEEMADAAELSQSRAVMSQEAERYAERSAALLDGAASIRNLKN